MGVQIARMAVMRLDAVSYCPGWAMHDYRYCILLGELQVNQMLNFSDMGYIPPCAIRLMDFVHLLMYII